MKLTRDRLKKIIKEELKDMTETDQMGTEQQPVQAAAAPSKDEVQLSINLLKNYFQKQPPGLSGKEYIKDIQRIEDFINSIN